VELLAGLALLHAGEPEEQEGARARGRLIFTLILQRIGDEEIRSRWFRARYGRALGELAGPIMARPETSDQSAPESPLGDRELELVRLVAAGMTNHEIAQELGLDDEQVARQLVGVFAQLGVVSRAGVTTAALMGGLV
jgi:DNA-binding NarL/FixJ family response regulator